MPPRPGCKLPRKIARVSVIRPCVSAGALCIPSGMSESLSNRASHVGLWFTLESARSSTKVTTAVCPLVAVPRQEPRRVVRNPDPPPRKVRSIRPRHIPYKILIQRRPIPPLGNTTPPTRSPSDEYTFPPSPFLTSVPRTQEVQTHFVDAQTPVIFHPHTPSPPEVNRKDAGLNAQGCSLERAGSPA